MGMQWLKVQDIWAVLTWHEDVALMLDDSRCGARLEMTCSRRQSDGLQTS